jgi:hypothetical protein
MHDGSFATLADVVDYYARGGTPHTGLDEKIRPLVLTPDERRALVSFLETLSGDERPGLGERQAFHVERTSIRIRDLDGKPVAGLRLRVRPFGDRLRSAASMPAAFETTTGVDGVASFRFPDSTHVLLECDSMVLGSGPIPDWVSSQVVVATPLDVVSIALRLPAGREAPERIHAVPLDAEGPVPGTDRVEETHYVELERHRTPAADELFYVGRRPTGGASRSYSLLALGGSGSEVLGTYACDPVGTLVIDLSPRTKPNDVSADASLAIGSRLCQEPARWPRRGAVDHPAAVAEHRPRRRRPEDRATAHRRRNHVLVGPGLVRVGARRGGQIAKRTARRTRATTLLRPRRSEGTAASRAPTVTTPSTGSPTAGGSRRTRSDVCRATASPSRISEASHSTGTGSSRPSAN